MPNNDDGQLTTDGSTRQKKKAKDDELCSETKAVIRKFVHKVAHEGMHNLRVQYNDLKSYAPADVTNFASSENPMKCRYKDIVCFDQTRVILKWPLGSNDNFIHANWVTHELFDNKFICTQAPKEGTVIDFWRMVWQEKVKLVLMLCRCEESGKEKCAQYWPANVDEVKQLPIGLTIRCTKVDRSDENVIYTRLLLTYEKVKRFVDHRQWTTWPDKSVPQAPLSPFRLLHCTRRHVKFPSVIHCSAGVGRTGTMVAIEMIYKSLVNGLMPDPPALLKQLRAQRHLAVQTEDQYIYCHFAIVQLSYAKGWGRRHDVKMFCKEYKEYVKMVTDNAGRPPALNVTRPPPECGICRKRDQRKNDKDDTDTDGEQSVSTRSVRKKKGGKGTMRKKSKKKAEHGAGVTKDVPDHVPPLVPSLHGNQMLPSAIGPSPVSGIGVPPGVGNVDVPPGEFPVQSPGVQRTKMSPQRPVGSSAPPMVIPRPPINPDTPLK